MKRNVKGFPISKAFTCMKIYLNKHKGRLIFLAKLLYIYEQFIHLTQIHIRPNIQFLSTQQRAYQSFWYLPGLIPFASL